MSKGPEVNGTILSAVKMFGLEVSVLLAYILTIDVGIQLPQLY